ncbi:MAG: hypothetical protein M3Z36_05715 [Acidobacteriota bacterium]|nr:hypothetical protein [Acidobacteriota bacterium]
MATNAQIEANRKNAQHSTGPKTEAGKKIVARNAIRHGLSPDNVCLLEGESAYELELIIHDLIEEYRPATRTEAILVERMAMAYHHSKRALCMQVDRYESCKRGPTKIYRGHEIQTPPYEDYLRLLHRYHKDHDRGFLVAMEELRRCQALRKSSTEPPDQFLQGVLNPPLTYNPYEIGFVLEYPLTPESEPVLDTRFTAKQGKEPDR